MKPATIAASTRTRYRLRIDRFLSTMGVRFVFPAPCHVHDALAGSTSSGPAGSQTSSVVPRPDQTETASIVSDGATAGGDRRNEFSQHRTFGRRERCGTLV